LRGVGGGDPGHFSEDCLYLNVWSPAERPASLPVMVWLHGGGYSIGAGGLPPYDGKALAKRGAVVVTINYRLGHLGFFAHPALEGEDGERLYNFGLMDQISALRWVQENIASFGGDRDNVTFVWICWCAQRNVVDDLAESARAVP
jgi:para-nitrobenzyl esterase